jgi:hypothetical protein
MATINYNAILKQAFEEYKELVRERTDIDWKVAQKEQFIIATINMLPDEKKTSWVVLLDALSGEPVTLSDAIRSVLQASPKKFHTATEVRDELRKLKFDFSQYTANPLSSIHAALKRFKPEEAEVTKTEGVMAWRWKDTGRKLRRRRRIPKYNTYRGLNVLSVPNAYESTMYDLQPSSLLNMSTLLDTEAPRIILPSEANKNPRTK